MKVVLMAGGRGTRISELFPDVPKPLIPIQNMPVLERRNYFAQRTGVHRDNPDSRVYG